MDILSPQFLSTQPGGNNTPKRQTRTWIEKKRRLTRGGWFDYSNKKPLPTIMGKRTISLGHSMRLISFLDRNPCIIGSIKQLGGKLVLHTLSRSRLGTTLKPSKGQGNLPDRSDFDGDLVRRTAHPSRLHFHHWLDVAKRRMKDLQRITTRLMLNNIERPITHTLSCTLFPFRHQNIDELRHKVISIFGISQGSSYDGTSTARHIVKTPSPGKYAVFAISVVSLRTWNDPVFGWPLQPHRVHPGPNDNARRASPLPDRHARAQWNAPASYAPCPGYRSSPQRPWSNAHEPLSATRNSAFSELWYRRADRPPAAAGID